MNSEQQNKPSKKVTIIAVEDEGEIGEDIIPGPVVGKMGLNNSNRETSWGSLNNSTGTEQGKSRSPRILNMKRPSSSSRQRIRGDNNNDADDLQLSNTDHNWAGGGILASRSDLNLSMEEFAAGCNLLQAAARGDSAAMERLLAKHPNHVNFRDYDRRTALHVAASEGHLHVCQLLMEKYHARVNRSDRWGGSPLDDAHRHRQQEVIQYLRGMGATTGSGNRSTNLIQAAASGDYDEVQLLIALMDHKQSQFHKNTTNNNRELLNPKTAHFDQPEMELNKGDYDKRTALHLA